MRRISKSSSDLDATRRFSRTGTAFVRSGKQSGITEMHAIYRRIELGVIFEARVFSTTEDTLSLVYRATRRGQHLPPVSKTDQNIHQPEAANGNPGYTVHPAHAAIVNPVA